MKKPYLTLFALLLPLAVWAEASKPNVVFVLFDDFGYGQPPSYRKGSPFKTPNVDRLAEQGMRFTSAYAACHVCSPTRASILTGKYPARLGLTDWIPGRRNFPFQALTNVKGVCPSKKRPSRKPCKPPATRPLQSGNGT